jgi:hypothetical protein
LNPSVSNYSKDLKDLLHIVPAAKHKGIQFFKAQAPGFKEAFFLSSEFPNTTNLPRELVQIERQNSPSKMRTLCSCNMGVCTMKQDTV